MLCTCGSHVQSEEGGGTVAPRQNVARELSAKLKEGELKLLQGSIREAEASLREALPHNNEVLHLVLFFGESFERTNLLSNLFIHSSKACECQCTL